MKKILLLLMLFIATISFAQKPEDLVHSQTSYVDDFYGLYTPEQAAELDGIIRNFHNTVQISLVTVKSLEGYDPADFAVKLANHWGVGSVSNNGLLILIAPVEHKFYAATGKGVEAYLTDMDASSYYRELAKPKFKENDFFGGTKDILNKYIDILSPHAAELETAQTGAIEYKQEQQMYDYSNVIVWVLGFGISIGLFVIAYRKGKKKKEEEAYRLKKALDQYNKAVIDADNLSKVLKNSKIPESIIISNAINSLNFSRNGIKLTDIDAMVRYKQAYDALIKEQADNIKAFNRKKIILDNANNSLYKYNNSLWRDTHITTVTNLAYGLQNMIFTKGNDYQDDIKSMNEIITAITEGISTLVEAINSKNIDSLESIQSKIKSLEDNFSNLNTKLSSLIDNDNTKKSKARNAKSSLANEASNLLKYVGKAGVSPITSDITRENIEQFNKRLDEFDGLDLVKAYLLYESLLSYLNSKCRGAYNENVKYEEEVTRLRKKKEEEDRKKREKIEDEERRKRKRREEEEENNRRSSSSYSSFSSFGSSDSGSSSSSDSSFGGGSFGGGGGGGDW